MINSVEGRLWVSPILFSYKTQHTVSIHGQKATSALLWNRPVMENYQARTSRGQLVNNQVLITSVYRDLWGGPEEEVRALKDTLVYWG